MPQTYGAHETKLYYVEEQTFGETPINPAMLGLPAESLEPQINPNNIKVRGIGSIDLQEIKKGLRTPCLKIGFFLPSDAPINYLQYARADFEKSLSIQVIYYKGAFTAATDIISMLYSGSKFRTTTVQCSIEDVIKANVEIISQDLTVSTTKTPGANYADYSGAIPFYESYIKKGTTILERVTDWKFTIENNLKSIPVIRSTSGNIAKYLPYRCRDLSGEVVFEFESKEEFDDIINDAEFDLEFGLSGSNKAVLGGCKWEVASVPTRIEELVSLKASFIAKTLSLT